MNVNAAVYLQEIRAKHIEIHNKERQLRLLDDMLKAKGISYDPNKTGGTYASDGLEKLAIKHIEEERRIRAELTELEEWLTDRLFKAIDYIHEINSKEQQEVLTLRYIKCMTWSEILDIRECDDISSQHKLHKRALDSFQKILDDHHITTI